MVKTKNVYSDFAMNTPKKSYLLLCLLIVVCAFNAFGQQAESSAEKALCDRVSEIKSLPHYNEKGVNAVYDALAEAGERVVPCLIDKIADTTKTDFQNCPVTSDNTRVGDVAFYVLVRMLEFKFDDFLPPKVQETYKTEGIYAFYDYIDKKKNRAELQTKLREWYMKKQSAKL